MKYVIANFEDVTEAMVNDCVETSIDTLRHSLVAPDRVVLKYKGEDPAWIAALELTPLTHDEILAEIRGSDWTPEDII